MKELTILLASLALLLSFGCGQSNPVSSKFDRQAWLDGKNDDSRQEMVEALEKELRPSMSSDAVIQLLGEPDGKIDRNNQRAYIYGLGKGLVDYDEYRIIFDAEWNVESFRKVQG